MIDFSFLSFFFYKRESKTRPCLYNNCFTIKEYFYILKYLRVSVTRCKDSRFINRKLHSFMTTTAFLGNAKGSLWSLGQSPFLNSLSNIESPSISCHKQPFCVHCTSCDTFAHSAKADPLLPFANHCCKNWWQTVITCSPRLFKLESACSRNGNKRENEKRRKEMARW